MARSDLARQKIAAAGLDFDAALAAANVDGHSIPNEGKLTFVAVQNGGGGGINVTIQTPKVLDGDLAVGERVIAVGAGETYLAGPFPKDTYNQVGGADNGKIYVDFSDVTSVTVAALYI